MPSLRPCAPAFIACLLLTPGFHGTGCGPFFPENMLDQPRGILRPPAFDFISEFRKLQLPSPAKGVSQRPIGSPAYTLDLEVEEMERVMRNRIADDTERSKWLADYRLLRAGMLDNSDKSEFTMREPDRAQAVEGWRKAKARQWPAELPQDVKLYLDGAQCYSERDIDGARDAWKKLLELPPDERRLR